MIFAPMFYTYVLKCADGMYYVGSSADLKSRLEEHDRGGVITTRVRRPLTLVYYEACLSKSAAQRRERYLKTGYGRKFLQTRLSMDDIPQIDMGA